MFLQKGAQFLMDRQLFMGSASLHNQEERLSAVEWTKLCFPRFYFYDVLCGLTALLKALSAIGEVSPFLGRQWQGQE